MKKISLRDIFLIKELGSGRGTGAPAYAPSSHLHGKLPQQWPLHGQTGDPDSSPTMTVSRLLQQTMTDDDVEYWAGDPDDPDSEGASFDLPYTTNKDGFGNRDYNPFSYGRKMPREGVEMSQKILKEFIKLCLESCGPDCDCEKCNECDGCESCECKKNSIIDEDELVPEELEGEVEVSDEASSLGGGAIRGFTTPLGYTDRDKEQESVNQRSFGGGKYNN